MNSRATRVGTFEVCVTMHVALRMFIMRVLASQLHFLANRNADLTVPPLLWPVNCIKIGGHVEQPSGLTVHSLYCAISVPKIQSTPNSTQSIYYYEDAQISINENKNIKQ